ncbi:MAG: peptidoglycan-binding protein [Ignavibacteria bacterium]|nr:peptidoglycan-binding protein [Ignavibacteria bacterium]
MEAMKATNNRFETCVNFVLESEGGFVNDKYDAGGATKYGISSAAYPKLDIKNLTLEAAKEIYRKDYWDKCGCGELPPGIDLVVFDTAVNMGCSRAKGWLEQTENVNIYLSLRELKYGAIVDAKPSQKKFLKGWLNRIKKIKSFLNLK